MNSQKILFIFLCQFLIIAVAYGQGDVTTWGTWDGIYREFMKGQAIVGLDEGSDWEDVAPHLSEFDFDSVEGMRRINSYAIYFADTLDIISLCDSISKRPNVLYCEPDMVMYSMFDPFFERQWYLRNTGQSSGASGADIMGQEAAAITRGDLNTKIAILDRGIPYDDVNDDFLNDDLAGNRITLGCICHDEDYQGWNDPNGHGTVCTSIAGATADNNEGIAGVCPECDLVIEKMAHNNPHSTINVANALADAIDDHGAQIVSWSYGTDDEIETVRNAILSYANEDVLFTFPTGNSSQDEIQFPATLVDNLPNQILAVGGTDQNDVLWRVDDAPECFGANHGDGVSVTAPAGAYGCNEESGPSCLSLLALREYDGTNFSELCDSVFVTGQVRYSRGTSFSAPMVAGIAGLIHSLQPLLSPLQIKNIIQSSCDDVNALEPGHDGYDTELGHGRVNAFKALLRTPGTKTLQSDLYVRKHIYDEWSPYYLIDELAVPDERTLTIQPGTRIVFDTTGAIVVKGDAQRRHHEYRLSSQRDEQPAFGLSEFTLSDARLHSGIRTRRECSSDSFRLSIALGLPQSLQRFDDDPV